MASPLLVEIANWKLEAKLEDNSRYFFHFSEVEMIQGGARCYVLGRKGSGKTAISEHLHGSRSHNVFSQKLSFKNFPFRDLYDLRNDRFNSPNQYITLWKYLIYSSIAKQMAENQMVDSSVRAMLAEIYADDPAASLPRTIGRWTSRNFGVSVLGTGVSGTAARLFADTETTWVERVEILERLLEEHLDDSKYLVLFDELDEDYKDATAGEEQQLYNALLTSLFKAVQDVKALFPRHRYDVVPVVFLRDDIFDQLKDADRTKWRDLAITLTWSEPEIRQLLAHRISRAADPHGEPSAFGTAWSTVFQAGTVTMPDGRTLEIFGQMQRGSHGRPRDFIKYLQACAQVALARGAPTVSGDTFRRADDSYSAYLRGELEDEIHPVLPEIRQIMDVLSAVRKQVFRIDEFEEAYKSSIKKGLIPLRDTEHVLGVLFHFSIIGNQPSQKNATVFKHRNPAARLNTNEKITVHRGLFKALQIL